MRFAQTLRNTKETKIKMSLELDCAEGGFEGTSGIGFFDHMLNSFCVHGGFKIKLEMTGDLEVDCHHTVEDCGIVLGMLLCEILGERSGIKRFGEAYVPMDESLAFCALDISGRPYLVFDAAFKNQMTGAYDNQMTGEFFRALAVNAGLTLHIRLLYGDNSHHAVEAIYKAVARALSAAVSPREGGVLSAKGVL